MEKPQQHLLSHILNEANYDPTYIIGGKIINLSNAKLGSSDYLIAEADESDASFTSATYDVSYYKY